LYTNLCQKIPPPNPPTGIYHDTGNSNPMLDSGRSILGISLEIE
jgi:hypothetical protein